MTVETTQSSGESVSRGLIVEQMDSNGQIIRVLDNPKEDNKPVETNQDVNTEQNDGKEEELSTSDDSTGDGENSVDKAKKNTNPGVQKRLDKLTRKNHEMESLVEQQAALIKQLLGKQQEEDFTPVETSDKPQRKDYRSDEDFIADMIRMGIENELQKREAKANETSRNQRLNTAEDAAREKYDDYDEALELFRESRISRNEAFLEIIEDSDIGPEIMRHVMMEDLEKELLKLPKRKLFARLDAIEDELLNGNKKDAEPVKETKPKAELPEPPAKIKGPPSSIDDPESFTGQDLSEADMRKYVAARRKQFEREGRRPIY